MTAKGMTSVSVSYEVRRQLNTLRSLGGYKSVNEVLLDLIRHQRMARMDGSLEPAPRAREGHR